MTPSERRVNEHRAWLTLYIAEIRLGNWRDMKARIERQLDELCNEFERLRHDHPEA